MKETEGNQCLRNNSLPFRYLSHQLLTLTTEASAIYTGIVGNSATAVSTTVSATVLRHKHWFIYTGKGSDKHGQRQQQHRDLTQTKHYSLEIFKDKVWCFIQKIVPAQYQLFKRHSRSLICILKQRTQPRNVKRLDKDRKRSKLLHPVPPATVSPSPWHCPYKCIPLACQRRPRHWDQSRRPQAGQHVWSPTALASPAPTSWDKPKLCFCKAEQEELRVSSLEKKFPHLEVEKNLNPYQEI